MKEFRLKADATFYAKNIDNAMKKLGQHFISLSRDGLDKPDIIESGEIHVFPTDADEKDEDSMSEVLAIEVDKNETI